MKTHKWPYSIIAFIGIIAIGLMVNSCGKSVDDSTSGNAHLDVYLTDAPADYQAVWLDIQKVMVNTSSEVLTDESTGWIEVPMGRPGLYNLLDFRNGTDTLLAGVDLPAGTVSQIRLILGNDNSLVLSDGQTVPLTTPSGQQSGLKLNIHSELVAGIPYALVLDFDAARSIVKAGNSDKYILKPVIRTFAKEAGGAIEGVVLPNEAKTMVQAINGSDTLSAIPDLTGYFKFWGISEGSYQLIFLPDAATGYLNDTINNVQVITGEVTKLDPVTLTKFTTMQ